MRSGESAARVAAISAALREKSSRASAKTMTIVAVPKIAESERSPTSEVPNRCAQPQARV
jgi:hypothetical protein